MDTLVEIPTPRPTNHAPSIAVLDNGDRIVAWFGGSDEGNSDIDILVSRYDAVIQQWSEARVVTSDTQRSDQNPGLFVAQNGEIWLLYTSQMSRQSGLVETFNLQHSAVIRRLISYDNGKTWSQPETLFTTEGSFCRQPVQALSGGRLAHPQWLCFDDETKNGSDQPILALSDDVGETWRMVSFPDAQGRVHPNLVEVEPGVLITYFRSRFADWVYVSQSHDNGETWSSLEQTDIPNNNAGISALRLPSGKIAVISNDEQYPEPDGGVVWPYERTRLTIRVSRDGKTFDEGRVIESGDGYFGVSNNRSNRRHEYPHAVVGPDGMIHLVWAYNSRRSIAYVRFSENWIIGEPDNVHTDCKLWG